MSTLPSKILVVRNDRLGDFMLAYPTFLLLKQALPDTIVHALVPAYTREMALCCPAIDDVVIDPGAGASLAHQRALLTQLRRARYDALVTLYSTTRVGVLTWLAGIPYRLAPSTKIAAIFYNKRLRQRRSLSIKPEHEYNVDLALRLLADFGVTPRTRPAPPYLAFSANDVAPLREALLREAGAAPDARLIFIHAGSGGSANNLSIDQYAQLANALRSSKPHAFVITAGPGEEQNAQRLAQQLHARHTLYRSREGLRRFAQHLQCADLFISGSTGPLHIAGALDRPTAAFYTRRHSATSLRWQTLNGPDRRLAFAPPDDAEPEDMSRVDVARAAAAISTTFLQA